MSCHRIENVILCYPNIYKFTHNGVDFFFEWHSYLGPFPVKKSSMDPRGTIPKGFWGAIEAFNKLSEDGKKNHLISS